MKKLKFTGSQSRPGAGGHQDRPDIEPPALVSDEKITMTRWELQSFAVQVVRDPLAGAGRQLMSWSDNPDVSPSLWFVGDSGPEWVMVAAARYPAGEVLLT